MININEQLLKMLIFRKKKINQKGEENVSVHI